MFGKKQKEKMFRQGDILFMRVKEIPQGIAIADDKIIAHGEATGHTHRFEDTEGETVQVYGGETDKFVVIDSAQAILHHNEHKPITLPKGTYKVIKQREYDIMNDVVQQVRD